MPRQPDPEVEERILSAASKLWKKGGEKALTMRAVAQAAGTNTPAVYRRFPSRQAILQGLLQRVQKQVADLIGDCRSPQEACERYVEFALAHPHEYELFYVHAYQLPRPSKGRRNLPLREYRPNVGLMEAKLAELLGGSPEQYTRLTMSLWMIAHGTATILITEAVPPEHASELRSVFSSAVETMILNTSI